MNKKGQDYTAITTMEYAFLIVLAIFFSIAVVKGLEEQKINQLKADDLAMIIDSVFLLKDDVYITHDFGKSINVNSEFGRIRIYESDINKIGIKDLTVDEKFDFAEDIKGKKDNVVIRKEGNRVVIS